MQPYATEELLALGFSRVGSNHMISRDVRFFDISGFIGENVRIDTYVAMSGHVELHDDVHIAPFCFLSATGGKITLSRGAGMGSHVALLTKSDDYTAESVKSADKVAGDIRVGVNSIIGSGCRVLPGVSIGDNASIGSNCVVSRDVSAGDMVVSRGASLVTVGNRGSDA